MQHQITIASGAVNSSELNLRGRLLISIVHPAAMTGTAVHVEVYDDINDTWHALYDNGTPTQLSITFAANRATYLSAAGMRLDRFRLVSTDAEAAIRNFTIISF